MAIASETSFAILVRSWTVMIIFCFAGSAAGSCLSYGHSCWGAHGKRSGVHGNNNAYLVPTKAMTSDMQQNIPSYAKDQWILSRLIAERPLIPILNKSRARWNNLSKLKTIVPQRWDDDEPNAHIADEPLRDRNNNDNDDGGNRRNTNDVEEVWRNINDDPKEVEDILLTSRDDYNGRESKPQNYQLFKLLSNANDNFE